MYETTKTTNHDYHQKPISDMTEGELRAYRRELGRAALTGYCANGNFSAHFIDDITNEVWYQVESMIEYERREEREEGATIPR